MNDLTVMSTLKSELKIKSNLFGQVIYRRRILFLICRN
jgi:hypothetical protein